MLENDEHGRLWVKLSAYLSSKENPWLMADIQGIGSVDNLIRGMERGLATLPRESAEFAHLITDCLALSRLWIFGLYESLRICRADRTKFEPLASLFHEIELHRMPLAKHQPKGMNIFHPPIPVLRDDKKFGWSALNPKTGVSISLIRIDVSDAILKIASDLPNSLQ